MTRFLTRRPLLAILAAALLWPTWAQADAVDALLWMVWKLGPYPIPKSQGRLFLKL